MLAREGGPSATALIRSMQSANEAARQLAMADRVIVNKTDLVSDETVGEIERMIRRVGKIQRANAHLACNAHRSYRTPVIAHRAPVVSRCDALAARSIR